MDDDIRALRANLRKHDALVAMALSRASALVASFGEECRIVAFDVSTPSPLVLQPVGPVFAVNRAGVLITQAFDDPAAIVRLGISSSPSLLLAANDSRPAELGQYETNALTFFPAVDTLELVILPGASILGRGFVFYKMKT